MFLRRCERRKNGKKHTYWALVESYRTGRGSRQRVVAYLGELSGREKNGWSQTASITPAISPPRGWAANASRPARIDVPIPSDHRGFTATSTGRRAISSLSRSAQPTHRGRPFAAAMPGRWRRRRHR